MMNYVKRLFHIPGFVGAPYDLQSLIVERLDAEADTVNAAVEVNSGLVKRKADRIYLDGNFRIRSHIERSVDQLLDSHQIMGVDNRWRASAKMAAFKSVVGKAASLGKADDLLPQCRDIAGYIGVLACLDRETAVVANGRAKRDMNVVACAPPPPDGLRVFGMQTARVPGDEL